MTGEILSHFEIQETLGEGGMGVVYRARDTRLDRIVAIKLLPSRMLQTDVDRERFSLEARAAGNLNHPNICTVFEYDEVDGQALIAMECIEGSSLKERIEDRTLSPEEVLRIAKEVASGLAAAHARGIVHRDIKPANVLLTEDGIAKITDFGLAKLMDGSALTQTGISVGTIAYMAPEQSRGENVGAPADVWALGVVMYEMLMGVLPFPHEYPTAILYAIVNEEPRNLDLLEERHGSEIAALIKRCLDKDPSRRPAAREVGALLGGDSSTGVTMVRQIASKQVIPWRPVAALAGAILLAAIGVFYWSRAHAPTPDFRNSSIAILPIDLSGGSEAHSLTPADSTLRVTLDGLLQTVSTTIERAVAASSAGTVIPFGDVVDLGATTPEDAAAKLGADYVVASRIEGFDPVPTLAFTLLRDGENRVGEPVSVPILLTDLQSSYEAALGRIGGLLAVPAGVLAEPPGAKPNTNAEGFQLYTRAAGLLQQRSNIRSLDAAEDLLKQALELDSNFAAGHAALGQRDLYKFEATKDIHLLDEAERHCDEAIRLEPELIDAYVTLGSVLAYTGKLGQAQQALERALDREPFNAGALLGLAEVQEDLSRYDVAEQTFKRAIDSRPDYWGGYNRLGKFYVGRSQWEKAAEQYRKVIDLAPSNSIGYRNLGAMMWYLGRVEDARKSWELSLEIEPSYSVYNNLGTMHFYERNYAAAAAAYEKALEINSNDHRVWGHLATAYYWMKADRSRYLKAKRKAAEMAEALLVVNPTDETVKADLAGYYAELGKIDESRALLNEFGPVPDPEISSQISFEVGAAWEEVGDRGAALAWIEDALEKGYALNEVTEYPGLDALRADTAFVRILRSLPSDPIHSQ